jgi:hypothetical protein
MPLEWTTIDLRNTFYLSLLPTRICFMHVMLAIAGKGSSGQVEYSKEMSSLCRTLVTTQCLII